jgi:putative acetyltransferase
VTLNASCSPVLIRTEERGDIEDIFKVTHDAFTGKAYSSGTEAQIINQLRNDGDLTLSMVAVNNDGIVGHIAFSPVTIQGKHNHWFGLGPVSVVPHLQRQGIGTTLINAGLLKMQDSDACGVALIGNPDYYCRFGFTSNNQLTCGNTPAAFVQYLAWRGTAPSGEVQFCNGFNAT